MSEENQANGTSNGGVGDVPEIELIIKEEFVFGNAKTSVGSVNPTFNQGISGASATQTSHIMPPKPRDITHVNVYVNYAGAAKNSAVSDCDARKTITSSDNNYKICLDNNKTYSILTTYQLEQLERVSEEELAKLEFLPNDFQMPTAEQAKTVPPVNIVTQFCSCVLGQKKAAGQAVHGHANSDLASLVSDVCAQEDDEDLMEDIENQLDLNLKRVEPRSNCKTHSTGTNCARQRNAKIKPDSEALQQAVKAVLDGDCTLGEASRKYKVVKSTIWTRVAKHPKHQRRKTNDELAEKIYQRLKAGDTISAISRELSVAKSTVHQHKGRLIRRGKLSPNVKDTPLDRAMCKITLQERLARAHRDCHVHAMSVRFAAEFHSLPVTTLWRYIKKRNAADREDAPENDKQQKPESNTNDVQVQTCIETEMQFDEVMMKIEPEETELNEVDAATYTITLEAPQNNESFNNSCDSVIVTEDGTQVYLKTELNAEDHELFEQTLLDQLFE